MCRGRGRDAVEGDCDGEGEADNDGVETERRGQHRAERVVDTTEQQVHGDAQ